MLHKHVKQASNFLNAARGHRVYLDEWSDYTPGGHSAVDYPASPFPGDHWLYFIRDIIAPRDPTAIRRVVL